MFFYQPMAYALLDKMTLSRAEKPDDNRAENHSLWRVGTSRARAGFNDKDIREGQCFFDFRLTFSFGSTPNLWSFTLIESTISADTLSKSSVASGR